MACAPLCLLIGAARADETADTQITLNAVRATASEGSQVRLLWTVTQGWLPAGGVNVFRVAAGTAEGGESLRPGAAVAGGTKLNAEPIKVAPELLADGSTSVVDRKLSAARKLFGPGVGGGQTGKPLSSLSAFHEFQGAVHTLQATPGVHPNQLAARASKGPQVQAYQKLLLPPKLPPATPPDPAAMSDDDKTISARIQITIASLTSYEAAQKLGMAFVDRSAAANTRYLYLLKSAADGKQLATITVKAGSPDAPPAPAPDAVQLGQGTVALHWEPVAPEVEKQLVGTTYNVYRSGSTKRLNASPVRLAYVPTTDGGHTATMASFVDNKAPQSGTASYTVTMTDAFGRVSPAGTASAAMVDLRVPAATPGVIANVSKGTPGAIRLFWVASDPATGDITPTATNQSATAVQYAVYRTASGQAETQFTDRIADIPPPGFTLTVLPAAFGEITTGQFFGFYPDLRTSLIQSAGTPSDQDNMTGLLKVIQNDPLTNLVLRIPPYLKTTFNRDAFALRTYLDTTPTKDTDYSYRVAPFYAANTDHYGTGAKTASLAVPTTALPPTPGGFNSAFTHGPGSFGYVDETAASPKMRLDAVVGAVFQKPHFAPTSLGVAPAPTGVAAKPVLVKKAATRKLSASLVSHGPIIPITDAFVAAHAKYQLADNEKAPPMALAGSVKLTWAASPFTSPVRYRVYRAIATGLFPVAQSASRGAPVAPINVNTVSKIGSPQKSKFADVVKMRAKMTLQYFEDFPNVPNQDFVLLGETTSLQYIDNLSVSQRVHYVYHVIPVSRWGYDGTPTAKTDLLIPATLPPSTPTLLKSQVDETIADGHVRLTIAPNAARENVTKYYVFRKLFSDSTAQAVTELSTVRVASRRGGVGLAPPKPVVVLKGPQSVLNVTAFKANNNLLLKKILSPLDYQKVGEIPLAAGATANLTFVDSTGVARRPYTYMVVAVNDDKISSKPSSPLDGTAMKLHCDPPTLSAPTLATVGDASQVTISWQPPTTETPTQYVLERAGTHLAAPAPPPTSAIDRLQQLKQGATITPATYVTLATTPATQFIDTTVRSGRRYTYRLRAIDSEALISIPVSKSVDVPALAPVAFNDPAPPAVTQPTPTVTSTTPLTQPDTPTKTTTVTPPNSGGTIGRPAGGLTGGLTGTPKASPGAATFANPYFLTGRDVFAVQVVKASYRVAGYAIDAQNYYYCRPTEKFLQLTLLVKNVTGQPQPFDYQTITAGGLTADGDDLAQTKNWKALDTNTLANRTVPAGASFTIEGVVTVPADGDPKTLTFGALTFDMTDAANHIDPLPAALGGGNAAPAEAPAKTDGTFYSLAFTDGALKTTSLPAGLGIDLTVRNATQKALSVANANYTVELYDEDGDKYPVNPSTAAPVSLAPGAKTTLHFAFDVPKSIKLQSVKVRERDGRIYVFPAGTN